MGLRITTGDVRVLTLALCDSGPEALALGLYVNSVAGPEQGRGPEG